MQKKGLIFLNWIFISILPTLFLYVNNIQEIKFTEIIRPLLLCFLFSCILFVIIFLLFKPIEKANVITSMILLLFFVYGHIYDFLRSSPIFKINFGRHSFLAIIFIAIIVLLFLILRRKKLEFFKSAGIFINISSAILLIITIGKIVYYELRPTNVLIDSNLVNLQLSTWQENTKQEISQTEQGKNSGFPDIYLIILDMYGRQDALRNDINFDNSYFIDELKRMGFYIANCARSNYAQTRISISSILNMNYIPDIGVKEGIDDVLEEGINHSLVRKQLAEIGYRQVAFNTGFDQSEITDAELYLSPPAPSFFEMKIHPFEAMLIRSTLLRMIIDIRPKGFDHLISAITFPYSEHVSDIEYTLDNLKELPKASGKKFIYVHLLVPHPPYLFNEDGTVRVDDRYYRESFNLPISEEYFQKGYANNLLFINKRILSILDTLINKSAVKPIVILQGDHGIRFENRMEILNAYYFPDNNYDMLYSSISPVNSFRVIMDKYFNTDYSLLEDKSYYSEYPNRYEFNLVDERSEKCNN